MQPGWTPENAIPELGDDASAWLNNLPSIPSADGTTPATATPIPVPTPLASTPSPDAPPAGAYVRVGQVTSTDLLTGNANQYTHLDHILEHTVARVAKYLTDNDWTDRIVTARLAGDTSDEYKAVAAEVDRLAVADLSIEARFDGPTMQYLVAATIDEILGLGPIEPLMRDPRITEVMVNNPNTVYVEIGGREWLVPGARFRNQDHLYKICQDIVRPIGRAIDQRNAIVDARLPDGSRVNIVHHTLAADGPVVTIRKFPEKTWTLADLVGASSMTEEMAVLLAWLVRNRVSLLVSGGTGSGKTSLLNALSGAIPPDQRTITIEDSRELQLAPTAHWLPFETRDAPPGKEAEAFTIRRLVKNALRQKPKRIIVGEVRDAAALDMLNAMNTGHEGSMSTVHANGPEETIDRLLSMIAQGGETSEELAARLISSAVDVIVYQAQGVDGIRRVTSISEVLKQRGNPGEVTLRKLWEWVPDGHDERGFEVGHYESRADISPELVALRRLQYADPVTMNDLHEIAAAIRAAEDVKRSARYGS